MWFATGVESSEIVTIGDSGPHVANITKVLAELGGYRLRLSQSFTEDVSKAIKAFQDNYKHRNIDGIFGPGTCRLLTQIAIEQLGPEFFQKLEPAFSPFYHVFISYAWDDAARVNKLDQWLRDHDIFVRRDIRDFQAGQELPHEIGKYLQLSDKALIVYSPVSQPRDWPSFERFAAERVEALRGTAYLVYLLLDGVSPPKHDIQRIYVDAANKPLKDVGQELLHAIAKVERIQERYEYNENEPL